MSKNRRKNKSPSQKVPVVQPVSIAPRAPVKTPTPIPVEGQVDKSPAPAHHPNSLLREQLSENGNAPSSIVTSTPKGGASSVRPADKTADQLLTLLEQERDELKAQLADQQEINKRLQQQFTEIKEDQDTAAERAVALEAELKSLKDEGSLHQAELAELARLRQESASYQANLSELAHARTTIQNLNEVQDRLQKLLAEEQAKQDKLIHRQEVLDRREQRLVDLQAQLDEMSAAWQPERVKELELIEQALRRQVAYLEGQVVEYVRQIEELETSLSHFSRAEFEALRGLHADLHRQLVAQDEELRGYRVHKAELAKYRSLLKRAAELEQKNTQLEAEKFSLENQFKALQLQLSQQEAYKALFDKARLETNSLKLEIEILNEAEQRRQQRGDRAFEALQELVNHQEYSQPARTKPWPGDVQVVRTVGEMASKNGFHFASYQIRALLAAIRSSRLVILRGFSGLGKTSLPILFARAIGAQCEVIPVQPSWRSKIDLLGFYNHFEQRFLPTQFTEALLKAQLPAFRDRLFFIVLDEMNLARIEYYFSDFNVKLEDPNNPAVELFEQASVTGGFHDKKFGQYIRNGNEMLIPPNVMFIGTINDDETTFAISDKIYDRSQVIDFFEAAKKTMQGELPAVPQVGHSLSFESYQSIGRASRVDGLNFSKIDDFLNDINQALRDMFYLSLSYRPRRQIRDFIQAYTLGGGDESEALDLQIISKVIPKIRYSHRADFDEQLTEFGDKLEKSWPFIDKTPSKTKERLELLRKQG